MLWLKSLHIIAVVCWFAGLFYLPRLFVYHAMTNNGDGTETFKVMERKLYNGIMTPSMIATLGFGIWLILLNPEFYFSQNWMIAKLVLVAILVIYHFLCGHFVRLFAQAEEVKSHLFFRWFNEFPVLILVAAVILVVARPF